MTFRRSRPVLARVVALALLCGACPDDAGAPDGGLPRDAPPEASATCDGIPQCRFACPEGTVNPKDRDGCTHSCTCVLAAHASEGPVPLKMYSTCGDPVCGGPRVNPGVSACGSADVEGAACNIEGVRCDRQNQCNQLLVCARTDPKAQPGGCPIAFMVPQGTRQVEDGSGAGSTNTLRQRGRRRVPAAVRGGAVRRRGRQRGAAHRPP